MSCRFFKAIDVTLSGNDITVDFGTIPNFTLQNLRNYRFLICRCIPCPTKIGNVKFKINATAYDVLTNSGNIFRTDQLRRDIMYYTVYGNNPKHFLVKNWLPPTGDANASMLFISPTEFEALKTQAEQTEMYAIMDESKVTKVKK